jgi:hypothetical protein
MDGQATHLEPAPKRDSPLVEIFLSHNTRDRHWCEWLRDSAKKVGVSAYLAEHDSSPGTNLAKRVTDALDRSDAVVVLITNNSVSAPYVNQEIGYALKARKLIIPLVQPGVSVEKLGMLQGIEYIPFDFDNPNDGHSQLIAALQKLVLMQTGKKAQKDAVIFGLGVLGLILLGRSLGPIDSPSLS